MDKHVQCLTFHTYKMCRIEESLATPLQDLDFRTSTFLILNSRGNVHCSDHVTATRPGAARASDAAGRPPAEAPGSTAAGIAAANGGAAGSRTPGRAGRAAPP